ncbi:MAG: hypothetical protein Q8O91_06005 [Candidatus Aminicenantes bacterium]|nr:hypothetical protein [Candidatus Aminicenantes bacterium]
MSFFASLILSAIAFLPLPQAAGPDPALRFAEAFMDAGLFDEAVTEYKRFIFFYSDSESADVSLAYARMGFALGYEKRWPAAWDALNKAVQTARDERTRDERRLSLAAAELGGCSYAAAKFLLLKLETFSIFPEVRERAMLYHAVTAVYEYDWEDVRLALAEYERSGNARGREEDIARAVALVDEARRGGRKSPGLAKVLSTVLPGAGQAYCGHWLDGLNALALNTLTGWLLVADIAAGPWDDVVFNSLFLFRRFYEGNRANAERQAREFNDRVDKAFSEKILNLIGRK